MKTKSALIRALFVFGFVVSFGLVDTSPCLFGNYRIQLTIFFVGR